MFKMIKGAVIAAALLAATAVPATSAHAETCMALNCDGQWPDQAGCTWDAYTPNGFALPIKHGTATTGWIELRYSKSCKTVWARVRSYYWSGVGEQAYIYRPSYPNGYECRSWNWSSALNAYSCYTPMLYDGGLTSRATGWSPNWYNGATDSTETGWW